MPIYHKPDVNHSPPAEQPVDTVPGLQKENLELKRALAELRDETAQAMRERFLTELLWGVIPEDLDRRLEFCQLPADPAAYKAVILFVVDMDPKEIASLPEPRYITRIIREHLSGRCKAAVVLNPLSIVAITVRDTSAFDGELIGVVNEICARCMNTLELRVTAGIGHGYSDAARLHDSFLEARAAYDYKSIAGVGKAIHIDDVQRGHIAHANPSGNLFSAVRFGSDEQITMHLADIDRRLSTSGEWEQQACFAGLMNEVHQIIERYELYNEKSVMDILSRLGPPCFDLKEWFLSLCLCMHRHIQSRRERAPHSLSEEAKRFIDLHYHESKLSVERLCEYLHVSKSYFSTVFRNETGVGYVQYLTGLRLDRAVALLQQTDERTCVIANKVGYDDPNYFSYVFKKRFGVSPARYRKSAREL